MEADKMTQRVQKSLNDAFSEAVRNHNQQVEVVHLLYALIDQEDGIIPRIIEKMGISVDSLKNSIKDEIGKPKFGYESAEVPEELYNVIAEFAKDKIIVHIIA